MEPLRKEDEVAYHLDEDRKNNSENNLMALCQNHHRMIHMFEFKDESLDRLREKGLRITELSNTSKTLKHEF